MKKPLKDEIRDQILHFVVGFFATVALASLMHIAIAAVLVALVAVGREIYQRVSKGNKWYACHSGCRLDLLFIALGVVAGSLTVIL